MTKPRVGIILQARMGSSRLPGKSLKPLAGVPMVQRVIERLQAVRLADELVLATSQDERDTPLANLAHQLGVAVFRGSESDVLDRYYRCAKAHGFEIVVRATGDNPMVDPAETDRLIDFFLARGLDYACPRTDTMSGYPIGVGTEAFRFDALERSWHEGTEPHHREHVNEYVLENPNRFKQEKLAPSPEVDAPWLSLTVDTVEQFAAAEALYEAFLAEHPGALISVPWIIDHLRPTGAPYLRM